MLKRRRLVKDNEVVLIYDTHLGFIQQAAVFKEYRSIIVNNAKHDIPVFLRNKSEITGLECFWLLAEEADQLHIDRIQRGLIDLQIRVSEIGKLKGYEIPQKVKDVEIEKMADERAKHRAEMIEKMGYDPLDYSWVEREMARTPLERKWFAYQRENDGGFDDNWTETVSSFKKKHNMDVTVDEAFNLTRKWKRFLIGAWNTISAQNPNVEDWKEAAKKFESFHADAESRMERWSKAKDGKYPTAKVKQPVPFQPGPYFNECIERIPKLFSDKYCSRIKEGVILRVISYDPEEKFIRLDFTSDVREIIKPGISESTPWRPLFADYVIYVLPDQIEEHLEMLTPLD